MTALEDVVRLFAQPSRLFSVVIMRPTSEKFLATYYLK